MSKCSKHVFADTSSRGFILRALRENHQLYVVPYIKNFLLMATAARSGMLLVIGVAICITTVSFHRFFAVRNASGMHPDLVNNSDCIYVYPHRLHYYGAQLPIKAEQKYEVAACVQGVPAI